MNYICIGLAHVIRTSVQSWVLLIWFLTCRKFIQKTNKIFFVHMKNDFSKNEINEMLFELNSNQHNQSVAECKKRKFSINWFVKRQDNESLSTKNAQFILYYVYGWSEKKKNKKKSFKMHEMGPEFIVQLQSDITNDGRRIILFRLTL